MKQNKFILLPILVLFAFKNLSRFLGCCVTKGRSVQVFVCSNIFYFGPMLTESSLALLGIIVLLLFYRFIVQELVAWHE